MNKSSKWIVKILMIFIVALIVGDFVLSEPKYVLSEWIVLCLALLVILGLSDVFDNLSIPKVISLSKDIKEAKKENSELKETNLKLMEQIVNIKNTNSLSVQINGSTNPDDINKNKLEEIENTDIENKKGASIATNETINVPTRDRIKYRMNLKKLLLQKALTMDNFNELNDIKYDVRVLASNPSSNVRRFNHFDACVYNSGESIFYESRITPSFDFLMFDLERKISSLELYNEANIKCKLIYVIPELDEPLKKELLGSFALRISDMKNKIVQMFEKNIDNNILEIREIKVSKKELNDYIKKQEKENKDK